MDLEDKVSLIKMRIHKVRKTYNLETKLPEKKNDNESNSKKSGKKLKVQRV